ncbi:MAG: hypothetical protein [Caudoviricetes sp.]|nr:MAG: hypothetical protein [Caudoviricetes sp.]
MNKSLLIGVILLSGCVSEYVPPAQQLPAVPAESMTPPCTLALPSADADEDLQIDVTNADCVRQLRLKVYRLQDWVRNVMQK